MPLPLPTKQDEVSLKDFDRWERLIADYDVIGFSTSDHPMAFIRSTLGQGISSTIDLNAIRDGARVRMAGLVVCRQRPVTASGFLFLVLEDEYGLVNVIVRPKVYERYRALSRTTSFLVVGGVLQYREGVTNVIATTITALHVANEFFAPQAHSFR